MAKLHKDMPMEKYHGSKETLSKTGLTVFADCPARYKYLFMDGGEKPETDSLRIGKAVHTLALEPEKWKSEYVVFEGDRRTVQGKKDYAEAMVSGKTIIRTADLEKIEGMANALVKNPFALALLKSDGYVEATIEFEYQGIAMKCRPDFMRNDGLIVDLKTTRSAKPSLFTKDAYGFGYDLSVAITAEGYKALHGKYPEEYVFLCIEPEAPHIVSCFASMSPDAEGISMHEVGRAYLDRVIERFKECKEKNVWPAYQEKIVPIGVPSWVMNRMEV